MTEPTYYSKNKEKMRKYYRKYRAEHPERVRQWGANWRKNNPEKVKSYKKRFVKTRPENLKQHRKNYAEAHPKRVYAHRRNWLLPIGEQCSECGSTENLVRHHPDYSKPKQVITLCDSCHRKLHAGEKTQK